MSTVHLVFKTHLDLGFTDLAAEVERRYFEHFIPQAVALAGKTRGTETPFRWTVGSWLIYEYLERAAPDARRDMEAAIETGDIIWHALPFTPHCEVMGRDMFRFGLTLSQQLDARFGRKTITAKMTDVPGHTRGIVPLLAEAGVEFLHLGVNEASPLPDVPPVFIWRDEPSGEEIVVAYNGNYGDAVQIDGLDDVLAFSMTGDNLGPQTQAGIAAIYDHWRSRFPDAQVIASTMNAFALKLRDVRANLPVITSEIGDAWIHGVGSDPVKLAQYRELSRHWIGWRQDAKTDADKAALDQFARRLMLVAEHTWGLDVKTHLATESYHNYGVTALQQVRTGAAHQKMEQSWAEQRAYLTQAHKALRGTRWDVEAGVFLEDTAAGKFDLEVDAGTDLLNQTVNTEYFTLRFGEHGEITSLVSKADGRVWFNAEHPLGLLRYESFDTNDYNRFWQQFIRNKDRADVVWWSSQDYHKAGMGSEAQHQRFVLPQLQGIEQDEKGHIHLFLSLSHANSEHYRPAQNLYVRIVTGWAVNHPYLRFDVRWINKLPARLPEAYWFSVEPIPQNGGRWLLDKLGTQIDARDVVRQGNRQVHAVGEGGAAYQVGEQALSVYTFDAPLVCVGQPALLNFTDDLPDPDGGLHVNLYNNTWSTNFRMWYGDDTHFRFEIQLPR